ncbi:MAG: hypothetical protein P9X24_00580 [Candidatus Hatepunaea meridiana]|nr:hypothetical protein [Candidatus Hatepunaea meridiana]
MTTLFVSTINRQAFPPDATDWSFSISLFRWNIHVTSYTTEHENRSAQACLNIAEASFDTPVIASLKFTSKGMTK